MSELRYDAAVIRKYFDEFGAREWDRLERRPMDRVNFETHRRMPTRARGSDGDRAQLRAGGSCVVIDDALGGLAPQA